MAAPLSLGEILVRLRADVGQFDRDMSRAIGSMGRLSAAGKATSAGIGIGIGAVGALGIAAVKMAANFEDAFARVKKVLPKTTDFAGLSDQLIEISKTVPVAATELAEIAAMGGQMGVHAEDMEKFVDTVARLSVTAEMAGQQAAMMLARIAQVNDIPIDQIDRLGSSVVAVADKYNATAEEVLRATMQMQGLGVMAGFTGQQMIGLSTVLISSGLRIESLGTAAGRMGTDIQRAVLKGGDKLRDLATLAGMSADEFKKAWSEDAASTLFKVFEGIATQGDKAISTMDKLGWKNIRVAATGGALTKTYEQAREAVKLANDEYSRGMALQEKSNIIFNTTSQKWKLVKNEATAFGIKVGTDLLPRLVNLADMMVTLIGAAEGMYTWFQKVIPPGMQKVIGDMVFPLGAIADAFVRIRDGAKDAWAAVSNFPAQLIGLGRAGVPMGGAPQQDGSKDELQNHLDARTAAINEVQRELIERAKKLKAPPVDLPPSDKDLKDAEARRAKEEAAFKDFVQNMERNFEYFTKMREERESRAEAGDSFIRGIIGMTGDEATVEVGKVEVALQMMSERGIQPTQANIEAVRDKLLELFDKGATIPVELGDRFGVWDKVMQDISESTLDARMATVEMFGGVMGLPKEFIAQLLGIPPTMLEIGDKTDEVTVQTDKWSKSLQDMRNMFELLGISSDSFFGRVMGGLTAGAKGFEDFKKSMSTKEGGFSWGNFAKGADGKFSFGSLLDSASSVFSMASSAFTIGKAIFGLFKKDPVKQAQKDIGKALGHGVTKEFAEEILKKSKEWGVSVAEAAKRVEKELAEQKLFKQQEQRGEGVDRAMASVATWASMIPPTAATAEIWTATFWAAVKEKGFGAAYDAFESTFKDMKDQLPESMVTLFDKLGEEDSPLRAAADGAKALADNLAGLAYSGYLTMDVFKAFGVTLTDTFVQAGGSMTASWQENQMALFAVLPLLANVKRLHEEMGYPIDENTQLLLDQAEAAGIAFPVDPMLQMVDLLKEIAKVLGAEIPESARRAGDAIRNIPGPPRPDDYGPEGESESEPVGPDYHAALGFRTNKLMRDTTIRAHAGEAVYIGSQKDMPTLRPRRGTGDITISMPVTITGTGLSEEELVRSVDRAIRNNVSSLRTRIKEAVG